MPTPVKPFAVLTSEKRSHRTKSELNQRKQGEESLATGVKMKEWPKVRSNPVAHKEFRRINELLGNISKNDALNEGVINRYCQMVAECGEYEDIIIQINSDITEINEQFQDKQIEFETYIEYKDRLIAKQLAADKQLQTKRKMLFDIEKENLMTIQAALRSIPKKTENKRNALLEALGGD